MDLTAEHFDALTFDCYGTLVDWLGGIGSALAELSELDGADHQRLLNDREREEHEFLRGPFRLYGEILAESVRRAAALQSITLSVEAAERVATSMAHWPAFPDSHEALERLGQRFDLVLLSNVETHVLESSARILDVRFRDLITAEQVRSYKPATVHFDEALRRLQLPAERVLHVAQSLHHDVRPALALGWSVAWINRQGEELPADLGVAGPTGTFPDLARLADVIAT